MNAIVYTSNSGFTKRYAELLAAETGLPVYALAQASAKLNAGADIIYLGWLMAGSIKGYKKAANRYSIQAVCAVGMMHPGDKAVTEIREKNQISTAPVFYLQGGFDAARLHGVYKLMVSTMRKTVAKQLQNKADRTEEETELLELLLHGGDMVSPQNLTGVLEWYRTQG